MRNYNRGIALIAVLGVVLVVAVLALGGTVVYNQSKNSEKVIGEEKDEIAKSSGKDNAEKSSESRFSIKVLSPNGGESFAKGEDIIVRWTSKDIDKVNITALYYDASGKVEMTNWFNQGECRITYEPISASLGTLTIGEGNTGRCGVLGASNRIKIEITEFGSSKNPVKDVSDNYFSITESLNQTSSWKTYTSLKYDFSFKYPKEWTLETPNAETIDLYKYIPNNKEKQYEGLIVISVFSPNPAVSMGGTGDRPDAVSSSEVKIDGKSFTREISTLGSKTSLTYRGIIRSNLSYYATDKNNFGIQVNVYSYTGIGHGATNDFDSLLDQLMNTFKFTK